MQITLRLFPTSFPLHFPPFTLHSLAWTGSTYVSLKSAILPSLSIARLDVILQHHFIFELKDLQSDRNLGPSSVRGTLGRVYSDREAVLNPAELAEREAFLGSRPGTTCIRASSNVCTDIKIERRRAISARYTFETITQPILSIMLSSIQI